MARQRKKHHFWRNLLILLVLFGIYLYWGNSSIETDEATFTSGALPAGFDGCRIVQLSDLHGKYFGKGNERLYTAVKAAQPEYIFVTGDLVDRKTENPTVYAGEVGAALSAIAPTYYVTGNHEWGHGTKVVEEIKRTLQESGVTVLSNEFVPLTRNGDSIVLAGIDDPNGYADQETPQQLAQEVYAKYGDPFWLLLAHRNNNFNGYYCRLGADSDVLGPRARRHLAPAVYRRSGRHDADAFPLIHERLLSLHGRKLRGRDGVRQPRARQFAEDRTAHSESAAGRGHYTGKGLRLCVNFLPEAMTLPSSARATRASRPRSPARDSG